MKSTKNAPSKNAGKKIESGVKIRSGLKGGKLAANHVRAALEVMGEAPGTAPRKSFAGSPF